MDLSQATVFTIDASEPEASILPLTADLIQHSQLSVLLESSKARQLTSAAHLQSIGKGWQRWHPGPWAVAGSVRASQVPERRDGLCINGFPIGRFDAYVAQLLEYFDWAVFAYFTTYHDAIFTVAVRTSELCKAVVGVLPKSAVLACSQGPNFECQLRRTSFGHSGEEGWLAYELAQELGTGQPLILTRIDLRQPDSFYFAWNCEAKKREGFLWYTEPLGKLERVAAFQSGHGFYQLHRASDFGAYCVLWAMVNFDYGIVEATLACDADVDRLKCLIVDPFGIDTMRHGTAVASWCYGIVYGGAASENHAVFHARDACVTQRICDLAGSSGVSRF